MKNECYKYAKSIAEELHHYEYERAFRCPECGEIHVDEKISFDGDTGKYFLPCGCETELELELLSVIDYLEDALDIEYTLDSRKNLIGVNIYVTLGGPTCWIDTRRSCVVCRWGNEEGIAYFDSDISEEINVYYEGVF